MQEKSVGNASESENIVIIELPDLEYVESHISDVLLLYVYI